ncbi:hypothetical protein HMPREF0208_02568 [Citrobacter koseri]|nr:hypothetical protein HMPREF3207_02874 [Citrobacter koseri]KXB43568.1 hypothetical protein HMPREF0208_02568 [Citrobacter koseri]
MNEPHNILHKYIILNGLIFSACAVYCYFKRLFHSFTQFILPGLQVFFSLYMSFNLSRFDIYH